MTGARLPYADDFAAELTRDLWDRIKAGAPTSARPRQAATLMVFDRSGKIPKVLMGRRNASHKFMPDRMVFPGGRVEPCDGRMPASGALDAVTGAKLAACLRRPGGARALAMAAIRETFEETGLLIGDRDYGAPGSCPEGAWSEFAAQGVFPALEDIHFIGRAITPPRNRLRFDTFFLAVDAASVADRVEGKVGAATELVETAWVSVPDALGLNLVPITHVMLRELANRFAIGLDRRAPVPCYRAGRTAWERIEV